MKPAGAATEQEVLQRYPDLQPLAASLQPLCTVEEAAQALRVSIKSVRVYCSTGALRAARAGGSRVLIPRVEVLRHVAARLA